MTNDTMRFLDGINALNDEGKNVLLGEMSEMVKNPEYTEGAKSVRGDELEADLLKLNPMIDGMVTECGKETVLNFTRAWAEMFPAKEGEPTLLDAMMGRVAPCHDDFEGLDGIQKRYAHIDPANIEYMGVVEGSNGEPCLMVLHNEYDEDATRYDFPLCHGWQIYIANDFLRSLNLGVYVSFESFQEYAEMVDESWKRLQAKHIA